MEIISILNKGENNNNNSNNKIHGYNTLSDINRFFIKYMLRISSFGMTCGYYMKYLF